MTEGQTSRLQPPSASMVEGWVARAQAGDRAAFRAIYEHYAPRVVRTVRALSDSDAEDIAHDAFVTAWERLDHYELRAGASFGSWLITIALNLARARRRRRGRLELVTPAALDTARGCEGEDAMGQRRLAALLRQLPERDRHVIALRYAGELTASEVAVACRLSEANVRKICQRRRGELLEGLVGGER